MLTAAGRAHFTDGSDVIVAASVAALSPVKLRGPPSADECVCTLDVWLVKGECANMFWAGAEDRDNDHISILMLRTNMHTPADIVMMFLYIWCVCVCVISAVYLFMYMWRTSRVTFHVTHVILGRVRWAAGSMIIWVPG